MTTLPSGREQVVGEVGEERRDARPVVGDRPERAEQPGVVVGERLAPGRRTTSAIARAIAGPGRDGPGAAGDDDEVRRRRSSKSRASRRRAGSSAARAAASRSRAPSPGASDHGASAQLAQPVAQPVPIDGDRRPGEDPVDAPRRRGPAGTRPAARHDGRRGPRGPAGPATARRPPSKPMSTSSIRRSRIAARSWRARRADGAARSAPARAARGHAGAALPPAARRRPAPGPRSARGRRRPRPAMAVVAGDRADQDDRAEGRRGDRRRPRRRARQGALVSSRLARRLAGDRDRGDVAPSASRVTAMEPSGSRLAPRTASRPGRRPLRRRRARPSARAPPGAAVGTQRAVAGRTRRPTRRPPRAGRRGGVGRETRRSERGPRRASRSARRPAGDRPEEPPPAVDRADGRRAVARRGRGRRGARIVVTAPMLAEDATDERAGTLGGLARRRGRACAGRGAPGAVRRQRPGSSSSSSSRSISCSIPTSSARICRGATRRRPPNSPRRTGSKNSIALRRAAGTAGSPAGSGPPGAGQAAQLDLAGDLLDELVALLLGPLAGSYGTISCDVAGEPAAGRRPDVGAAVAARAASKAWYAGGAAQREDDRVDRRGPAQLVADGPDGHEGGLVEREAADAGPEGGNGDARRADLAGRAIALRTAASIVGGARPAIAVERDGVDDGPGGEVARRA